MPRFEPFRALRYAPSHPLADVIAPPYDVIDREQRDRLAASHRRNIVHIDVPDGTDPDRYRRAAALLAGWTTDGTFVRDRVPTFTIYRMSFTDDLGRSRETSGVLGALEVVDAGSPEVLPHERTTPKDSTDRLDLTRATRANLSPVWGLSLRRGLAGLLAEPAEPVGEVATPEGVSHRFERVTDPRRIADISTAVAAEPVLIADGHHRYSISRTYRDEVRDTNGVLADAARLVLTHVAELAEPSLSVAAIHRVYSSPATEVLIHRLSQWFHAETAGSARPGVLAEMRERGSLCFVAPGGDATWLTPREDRFAGVRDLDSARLEAALEGSGAAVSYQHGYGEAMARLRDGATGVVLIRPVSVSEILRTATEGLLMPPKSTFFTPKLLTGPVIRELMPA
ncbi:MAG: DUF1015 family protein [Acidobacteria bacterium]|nr:DUF1015 family protein [Acidobacteriota bacterium]